MQNPSHTTTEGKPGIDWAKSCINTAKTVWGGATVIVVPFATVHLICRLAQHEDTIKAAAWTGAYLGFMSAVFLTTVLFLHMERKSK